MNENNYSNDDYTVMINKAMVYALEFGKPRDYSVDDRILEDYPQMPIAQAKEIDRIVKEIRSYVEDLYLRLTTDELKQSEIDQKIVERYQYLSLPNLNKLKNLCRYYVLK